MASGDADRVLTRRELVRSAGLVGAGVALSPVLGRAEAAARAGAAATRGSGALAHVDWHAVARVSRTHATLQVVSDPLLRRGSPVHRRAFANLRALEADYVRYAAWYPYPRLAVAELEPPAPSGTSWDFRLIDPLVEDFMSATAGHPRILNFCTTPAWMWKTAQPVVVPADPDEIDLAYTRGVELAVPLSELGDYYRRLASWYVRGGFTDELGRRHSSPHHFTIDHWEVLNETHPPFGEHALSAPTYTRIYDEIVAQVARVSPRTKFAGPALSGLSASTLEYLSHFLNPGNHRPGTPVDWISYHFYAVPRRASVGAWAASSFAQADDFLRWVDRAEALRRRLSPQTRTTVNEVGTALTSTSLRPHPPPIPAAYWNFSAAVYAYVFANLALRGIDAVGESQLVGGPGLFPSVTMLDWRTGEPNARYRVLELLRKHIRPGSSLYRTAASGGCYALGFRTPERERKLLLVNKRDARLRIRLDGFGGAQVEVVDQRSAGGPGRIERLRGEEYVLPGYAVAVATMRRR